MSFIEKVLDFLSLRKCNVKLDENQIGFTVPEYSTDFDKDEKVSEFFRPCICEVTEGYK